MSAYEAHLRRQIGALRARAKLLERCCRDYEDDIAELRRDIAWLQARREGRRAVPPSPEGGERAA